MQHPSILLAVGFALGAITVVALESALTWSSGSTWTVASSILGVRASVFAWSSTTSRSSRAPLQWDVPSADVAASACPLRSVGERSAGNAVAHHARLAAEVKAADEKQGFELVIYGDSIIETLRGTDHGSRCSRPGCREGPGILRAIFGKRWRTAVIATGADQSGHLLHLLRNGGTPSAAKAPRAALLLIGTNNLTWPASQGAADPADFAAGAVVRLAAIVAHLREQLPATVLVLAGVLPRGFGGDWIGQWQTRRQGAGDFDWPNPFTKGVDEINAGLYRIARTTPQVQYVDCGQPYVKNGYVTGDLMPDALHPNGPGLEALMACFENALVPLLANSSGDP